MPLSSFLELVTGLGLFLFGMNLLSDSLSAFADGKVHTLLYKATDKAYKSVLLGATVTGIIQSSTATTLMTLGLVNSGVFSVFQALTVIMGANIGTTVTAHILSLADIDTAFLSFLKPSFFAPFFILIGSVEKVFFRKKEIVASGSVFAGAGILFFGTELTEKALKPLSTLPEFRSILLSFDSPFLLFFCGVIITVLLQSSSVTVGLLQTLSAAGTVSIAHAVPVILGINAGKCLPEFIAVLGGSKDSRTAVLSNIIINSGGCVIFALLFFLLSPLFPEGFTMHTATRSSIALFHSFFNITTTLIFLPQYKKVIKLAYKLCGGNSAKA